MKWFKWQVLFIGFGLFITHFLMMFLPGLVHIQSIFVGASFGFLIGVFQDINAQEKYEKEMNDRYENYITAQNEYWKKVQEEINPNSIVKNYKFNTIQRTENDFD